MSYLYLFLVLTVCWGVARLLSKFKIQSILIQFILLVCIVIGGNLIHFKLPINLLDIKILFVFCTCYLMSQILHESVEVKPTKKIMIFSFIGFIFPFLTGALTSYFILHYPIASAIIMGFIYSIVAVPVLYIYLKEMNYSKDKLFLYLQSAVAIDLLAWIVFAFLQPSDSPLKLLICIGLGLLPYTKRLLPFASLDRVYNTLFFSAFLYLEFNKLNGLLFAIIYLFAMRFNHIEFLIGYKFTGKDFVQQNIVIPVIILYGLLQINFSNIEMKIDVTLIACLILLPFISKCIGNYIAYYFIGQRPNKLDTIILNTRGLTEIVFLNMAKQSGFLSDNYYFYLILMSLLSTIVPGLLIEKYKKYENNSRNPQTS
jgi:Kef-type K+ transport system membrane component KefB